MHGLKGWLKVWSSTRPKQAIFDYQPWLLGEQQEEYELAECREQGKLLLARLNGVDDRSAAEQLTGHEIAVPRDRLPDPGPQSWYWTDLEGLEVQQAGGGSLGTILRMMETGAHDVMVVAGPKGEILIPFVPGRFVLDVDLERRRITVDWDTEFQ